MSFSSFQLHPQINAGIAALGYETPTPVQKESIPPILSGRDLMGLAQTGTGKTAAFALPILQRLLQGPRGVLRALVVAPTRELAEQIHTAFGELGRQTGLRSVAVYGGVGMGPQIQKLRGGAEIAVACPGRLLDHLNQKTASLAKIEVLVLDEADRMFDMGFLPDIRRILKYVPAQRQTLLFSATMPDDIRGLATEILRDPVTVQIGHSAPVNTVSHALYPVAQHLKTKLLLELLKNTDTGSVLIFARTKHRARRVGEQLEKAGFPAASLQGNLSQNRRKAALDGFRDGSHQILVATDIAARGIDVSSISHVINYDMPDTADAYTHRIGRTGRAAKTGDAFTLVTPDDEGMVRTIERLLHDRLERRRLPGFDYSASAPERNAEFARPPLPQRGFRSAPRGHSGSRSGQPPVQRRGFRSAPASASGQEAPAFPADPQVQPGNDARRPLASSAGGRQHAPSRGSRPGQGSSRPGGAPGGTPGYRRGQWPSSVRSAHSSRPGGR